MLSKIKTVFLFNMLLFLIGALIALSPLNANADSLSMSIDYNFQGSQPATNGPWATAIFDDSYGDANTVRLFMSANDMSGSEYISTWYFNFDPSLDSSLLSFTNVSNASSIPSISTGNDANRADGDGYYDIFFDFPTANNSGQFETGETVIYDITYFLTPISVDTFDFSSVRGNKGAYKTAAKIHGIGTSGNGTGWSGAQTSSNVSPPVAPEPISSTLFIVGGATLGFRRFRKSRKA